MKIAVRGFHQTYLHIFFSGVSSYLKNVIIDQYIINCNVINCVSCERVANHQAHVNCN